MPTQAITARVQPGGKVIELAAPGVFETAHRAVPEPGATDVVVEMFALGICGTDVHLYRGRGNVYPHVVGHDGAGVIRSVGTNVRGLAPGQRVTIDPITHCGECGACRAGDVQLCPTGGYLGMIGPGLLAQYVRLPAAQAIPLPPGVSDRAATVLEPLTVALHTHRRVSRFLPEPVPCAVVGAGPLGILLAVVLRHLGYQCDLFEPQLRRRELAAALGLEAHPAELVNLGDGPRLVIETSAAAAGVELADGLCTPGSVVAVVGRAPHTIAPPSVLLKELTILGIKGGPGMYPEAVRLVAEDVVNPAAVITHEFGWYQSDKAFRLTSEQPDEVVRAVIHGEW